MRRARSQLGGLDPTDRSDHLDLLAREAAGGDIDAASDLAWAVLRFRLARPAIRRYLLRNDDIEVVEQRTLVAVALRIGSFRGDARFTTWLFEVAKNESLQHLRSDRRHSDHADDRSVEDHADDFVARVSSMIVDRSVVREAIDRLNPDQRQALLLREDEGLTYDETADRLGVPLSTAKTRVRRGRMALAADLAESMRSP